MASIIQTENVRALLAQYLHALWRRKWIAIVVCWIVCVPGWIGVTMLPPQYDAQGRFYVDVDSMLTPLLRGIAIETNPLQQLDYLRQTLLSRPNLEQVIHLADLDSAANTPQKKEALITALASDIRIGQQTPNLFQISYRSRDPIVAKNVVQSVLTLFAERSVGNSRTEIDKARRFLDEEITKYESQLRAAEQRRTEFRLQYLDYLPGTGTNVSRLDGLRQTVRQLQGDYDDAVSKRDALKSELAHVPQFVTVESAPIVVATGQRVPSGTEARLEEARKNLDALRLRYTDEHPDVLALRRQIAELEAQVAAERKGYGEGGSRVYTHKTQVTNSVYEQLKIKLADAESTVAAAKRRLDDQSAALAELEKVARTIPEIEAKSGDLDRDYNIVKHNYEELLARREAAQIGQAADVRADKIQFRIVDQPQVPSKPSAPDRPLLFSVVLVIGLGAGAGLSLLLAQFDHSFSSVNQLRELGLPVLGSVGYLRAIGGRSSMVMQAAVFGVFAIALLATYGALVVLNSGIYRGIV